MTTESAQLYAGVLLDLAVAARAADQVAEELRAVAQVFTDTPGLARFFASPVQRAEHKREVVHQMVTGLNVSDLTRRFLGVVLANGRFAVVPAIAAAFHALRDAQRGIVRVQVESARPMDKADVAAVTERLAKRIGKEIEVEVAERPDLIGGLVAHVQSEEIDGSVRGKLRGLRTTLLQGAGR
jgi:F-type H+-transporting ATPase subunit delta